MSLIMSKDFTQKCVFTATIGICFLLLLKLN